jgi:glutathione S-transferase
MTSDARDQRLVLYVGTRSLSSWSLRAFLALAHVGVPFEERVIDLDRPTSRDSLLAASPAGRVPVLRHGELVIWDSLAICEYLAETFPEAALWPAARDARARARSISCEMHAGFAALRQHMSMDLRASRPGEGHDPAALADAARIMEIWRDCRARAPQGPYLFGAFSIADAMFAPVTTRFTTYAVPVDDVAADYVATMAAHPGMRSWRDAALAE